MAGDIFVAMNTRRGCAVTKGELHILNTGACQDDADNVVNNHCLASRPLMELVLLGPLGPHIEVQNSKLFPHPRLTLLGEQMWQGDCELTRLADEAWRKITNWI